VGSRGFAPGTSGDITRDQKLTGINGIERTIPPLMDISPIVYLQNSLFLNSYLYSEPKHKLIKIFSLTQMTP